jgi:Holliday junction resolvase RusA-like endonuclease|nr:MAG TPA: Endodeoxyribonuclease RusA [Caudoviricetes sp.]
MKSYIFEVTGEIVGKARPRMNTYTGKAYTPTKTKNYEYLVKQSFLLKYPNAEVLEGRASVSILALFQVPKSTSKKNSEKMLNKQISPTKKPDIDNIAKIVLDALNKLAYKDDTQVVDLNIAKAYADRERLIIKIEEF